MRDLRVVPGDGLTRRVVCLGVLGAASLAYLSSVRAQGVFEALGRVVSLEGEVQVRRADGAIERLSLATLLYPGDQLILSAGAEVRLRVLGELLRYAHGDPIRPLPQKAAGKVDADDAAFFARFRAFMAQPQRLEAMADDPRDTRRTVVNMAASEVAPTGDQEQLFARSLAKSVRVTLAWMGGPGRLEVLMPYLKGQRVLTSDSWPRLWQRLDLPGNKDPELLIVRMEGYPALVWKIRYVDDVQVDKASGGKPLGSDHGAHVSWATQILISRSERHKPLKVLALSILAHYAEDRRDLANEFARVAFSDAKAHPPLEGLRSVR